MNREYLKRYSPELGREMELLVFGRGGIPAVVFPTSMGRFFQYEDCGMVGVLSGKIDRGEMQLFCVDSVDGESWYNKCIHPRLRVMRHLQYERYLLHELLPYLRSRNPSSQLLITGCSFGGYHALNFALKHPDLVTHCVSLGGAFDIRQFLDGYYDDDCYFNCPPDYLSNLRDDWYLSRYRKMSIVLATGEWDMCMDQNVRMSQLLTSKSVPNWLDVWGDHCGHDWPWWQKMVGKYLA